MVTKKIYKGIHYLINWTLKFYEPRFYKARVLLKSGGSRDVIFNYRGINSEYLALMRYLKQYYKDIVLVEWVINLDNNTKTNKNISFQLYKENNERFKIIDYTLREEEIEDMALFKMQILYQNYYVQIISKVGKFFSKFKNKEMTVNKKIKLVKELRKKTNASMAHCNEAITTLLNQDNSMSDEEFIKQGITILDAKKQVVALKKEEGNSNFFVVKDAKTILGKVALLIKFGCSSEQGAKLLKVTHSEKLKEIAKIAAEENIKSATDLLVEEYDDNNTVGMILNDLSGLLGEKVEIVDFERIDNKQYDSIRVDSYIHGSHFNDKGGSLIVYENNNGPMGTSSDIRRKLLHQLFVTNPLCLEQEELLDCVVERYSEQIKEEIENTNSKYDELKRKEKDNSLSEMEKKLLKNTDFKKISDKVIPKVIKGKINKFKKEMCFYTQEYMFPTKEEDEKKSIKEITEKYGIKIKDFLVI